MTHRHHLAVSTGFLLLFFLVDNFANNIINIPRSLTQHTYPLTPPMWTQYRSIVMVARGAAMLGTNANMEKFATETGAYDVIIVFVE